MHLRILIVLCTALFLRADICALSLIYEVQDGDSLWSISQLFRVDIPEIKRLNRLRSNRIFPGQKLRLGPEIRALPAPNGPYYWVRPRRTAQQGPSYVEPAQTQPQADYRQAIALLRAFDADIGRKMGRRRPLSGWKIVIDPGHGGVDPGAIVPNTDGRNAPVYVVEDEYVYDIALRVYERLRLYGADVELTVLSPNHLIRENVQASITFVHEQNEIYNDERLNRKNSVRVRPGGHNLSERVKIANRFFKGVSRSKTLFLSLHADNSPERPRGPLVIYWNRGNKTDAPSRAFAQTMQKALDHPALPAQIQGRNLAVLRGNRAHAEILVEIRNVHDQGEAWALRYHEKRQADANRIVNGILEYIQ